MSFDWLDAWSGFCLGSIAGLWLGFVLFATILKPPRPRARVSEWSDFIRALSPEHTSWVVPDYIEPVQPRPRPYDWTQEGDQ